MRVLINFCYIFTLLTILSIIIKPSKFRNGIFILFCISFWFITLVGYFFSNPDSWITFIIVTLIIMLPICYELITLFIFINEIITIIKKGNFIHYSLNLLLSILMFIVPIALIFIIISNIYIENINILLFTFTLTFYFIITFVGFFCYSIIYSVIPKHLKCNYIIIHGPSLIPNDNMTPISKKSINKVIDIYNKCNKKPKIIVSGGIGKHKEISEAKSITNYLLLKGITKDNIILEKNSKNIYQSLKYSKKILDKIEKYKYYKCIFITSKYHVLRSYFYARKLNIHIKVLGCHIDNYYLPNTLIHEYLALMKINNKSFIILIILLIFELYLN